MNSNQSPVEPPTATLHTRRAFLRTSMLGAAVSWTLPVFLEKTFGALDALAADAAVQTVTGRDGPILVVLQMAGGNDGLNTVIPFADDAYHRARPALRFTPDQVLKLNDSLGLNPRLTGLKALYDAGHLAIVQGVGYPNPNRSHFRSTEIWQTATDADKIARYGWLGRYFDSCCRGEDPVAGVAIAGEIPQAFHAATPRAIAFSRPENYRWMAGDNGAAEALFRELNQPDQDMEEGAAAGASIAMLAGARSGGGGTALDFLQRTALDAQLSSDTVQAIARKTRGSTTYPGSRLAQSLALVARMIAGGLSARVYYVSQGGYDTHTNQAATHLRLLTELNDALAAFFTDLRGQGNLDRVLLLTFSEFGRRVAQNGSNGTDHGAAAPLFVIGGGVKGGIYGQHPSLTQLRDGDLVFHTDFRAVYATVLEKWLRAPSAKVLGRRFDQLRFL